MLLSLSSCSLSLSGFHSHRVFPLCAPCMVNDPIDLQRMSLGKGRCVFVCACVCVCMCVCVFSDAQPAQQAQCKVRTQVTEVTRGMLDRSNADFLLWPPCVEVQRCSGCCNTKSLHCVPVLTHTRYLQVHTHTHRHTDTHTNTLPKHTHTNTHTTQTKTPT